MSTEAAITTEALYAEHWQFVFQLLASFGVFGHAQEDVAQAVWIQVHRQIGTYDPGRQTPRAWITGFVRRCAANYRRVRRRCLESPCPEPGFEMAAPGPSPEGVALLRTIEQAIPDEEQREAFVLFTCHELTIEEIAAVTGLSKRQVEWRLQQARERLWTWEP